MIRIAFDLLPTAWTTIIWRYHCLASQRVLYKSKKTNSKCFCVKQTLILTSYQTSNILICLKCCCDSSLILQNVHLYERLYISYFFKIIGRAKIANRKITFHCIWKNHLNDVLLFCLQSIEIRKIQLQIFWTKQFHLYGILWSIEKLW